MDYLSRVPDPPLRDFIGRLWHLRDAPPHAKEIIVPSGTIELVINLHENVLRIYDPVRPAQPRRYSGAIVSGTYARSFLTDTEQHATIVGVHFLPGGAGPFLGLPADKLADSHVELEELWGRSARELREQLCAIGSPAARLQALERTLCARLARARSTHAHYAVRHALNVFARDDTPLMRDLARQTGLSPRRFSTVFAREVGLSPKQFARVRRFQRTLALTRAAAAGNWAQVAADCGYFDQAHLIHEFRSLTQLTPAELLRRQATPVMPNHVAVPP